MNESARGGSNMVGAMLTSGHVSVICSAMLLYVVPYTGRETLCFSMRLSAG